MVLGAILVTLNTQEIQKEMIPHRTSRKGRKRWSELVKFLTATMKTASSERVRMQAAMRLADILTLREQREQLELRMAVRAAEKGGNGSTDVRDSPDEVSEPLTPQETALHNAQAFLARINAGAAGL